MFGGKGLGAVRTVKARVHGWIADDESSDGAISSDGRLSCASTLLSVRTVCCKSQHGAPTPVQSSSFWTLFAAVCGLIVHMFSVPAADIIGMLRLCACERAGVRVFIAAPLTPRRLLHPAHSRVTTSGHHSVLQTQCHLCITEHSSLVGWSAVGGIRCTVQTCVSTARVWLSCDAHAIAEHLSSTSA
jgi:hypothetical protein